MTTRILPLLGLALAAACSDFPTAPASGTALQSSASSSAHSPRLGKYVAMGTSLSGGVMSNGVVGRDQAQSWTAQLARLAETPFSLPLISEAGCQPPLATPLASLRRVNGESALVRSAVCSPLVAGITAPTQNLALSEATTFNALGTTPESAPKRACHRSCPITATAGAPGRSSASRWCRGSCGGCCSRRTRSTSRCRNRRRPRASSSSPPCRSCVRSARPVRPMRIRCALLPASWGMLVDEGMAHVDDMQADALTPRAPPAKAAP